MSASLRSPGSGLPPKVVTEALAQTERRVPGAEASLWAIVHLWVSRLAGALLVGDGQRHRMTADDLVHESFLRVRPAYLRLSGLHRTDLQALVVRVMRQVLIDESRRQRPLWLAAPELVTAAATDAEERLCDLRERLDRLAGSRGTQRRIVDLHIFEDWTFEQIAAELHCSASWARRQYREAITTLRDYDEPEPTFDGVGTGGRRQ